MRRRTFLLLSLILAVVTAAALLLAAVVVPSPGVATDPDVANAALVREYYRAMNDLFRAGDAAVFADLVAVDVVIADRASDEGGRNGLARRLLALRAAQPHLRVAPADVIADGDVVVARVSIVGVDAGAMLARPVAANDGWGSIDGFRIDGGRIVEHWGATPGLAAATTVLRAEFVTPPATLTFVGLARLTLARGATIPVLVSPQPVAIAVESGALGVKGGSAEVIRGASRSGRAPVERIRSHLSVTLAPGDQVTIPAGVGYALRSEADAPAVALIATMFSSAAAAPHTFTNAGLTPRMPLSAAMFGPVGDGPEAEPEEWPDGTAGQRLVGAVLATVPAGPLRLRVDSVMVRPGAGIDGYRPLGVALLAGATGQAVSVTRPITAYSAEAPAARETPDGTATVMRGGETLVLTAQERASIRNVAEVPFVGWLVSVEPAL